MAATRKSCHSMTAISDVTIDDAAVLVPCKISSEGYPSELLCRCSNDSTAAGLGGGCGEEGGEEKGGAGGPTCGVPDVQVRLMAPSSSFLSPPWAQRADRCLTACVHCGICCSMTCWCGAGCRRSSHSSTGRSPPTSFSWSFSSGALPLPCPTRPLPACVRCLGRRAMVAGLSVAGSTCPSACRGPTMYTQSLGCSPEKAGLMLSLAQAVNFPGAILGSVPNPNPNRTEPNAQPAQKPSRNRARAHTGHSP